MFGKKRWRDCCLKDKNIIFIPNNCRRERLLLETYVNEKIGRKTRNKRAEIFVPNEIPERSNSILKENLIFLSKKINIRKKNWIGSGFDYT